MVRRISYAFDLGNSQFNGEMSVWRSHSRKRLDSVDVRLRRGSKLASAQYLKWYPEVMSDVVPHWLPDRGVHEFRSDFRAKPVSAETSYGFSDDKPESIRFTGRKPEC